MLSQIRPDAPKLLAEAKILLLMIRDAKSEELRKQHLDRLERLLDALSSSIVEG